MILPVIVIRPLHAPRMISGSHEKLEGGLGIAFGSVQLSVKASCLPKPYLRENLVHARSPLSRILALGTMPASHATDYLHGILRARISFRV